ncbi:MAG: UvrD-helicase domain-containing protein [Evtepia gabavorous]
MDEFLIITFTRAAARSFGPGLPKEIAEALAAQPDHAHLRQQTVRLYETQISTIHAFCTVLLRQWGHLLDIPGDFALCEDEEAQVLMTRTLNQVLEARYEEIDPTGPFARLLDVLSKGRDDSRLLEITLDIYGKIQSYPDPLAWLASQREALDLSAVTDVGQTPWGSLLLEEAGQTAAYWADQMAWACDLAQKEAGLEKAYGDSLQATRRSLEAFVQAAGTSWDEAARVEIVFPKLKAARGVEDPALQEQIKSIRARCKKAVEELTQTVSGPSAPLLADMALVYPAMLGLLDLVEDFSRAYEAAKKQRSLLDFSDLEHLAVRLLVDEAGGPTPLARQWGARYTEIMVDEYQDTNQVQNTIFQALSQEGRNLFMVGDVKQSIYRFRLADPTIFLEKYRTFPHDQAQVGQSGGLRCPKIFAPAPRFWRRPTICFVPSCPGGWGRWTTQTGRPCTLAARFRRERAMRRSFMCWTLQRTQRTPRRSKTAMRWRPGLWRRRSQNCSSPAFPCPMGPAGPVRSGRMILHPLRSPARATLHPGVGGAGGGLVRGRGGRSVCCLRGLSGPLLASDHRQPPAGYPPAGRASLPLGGDDRGPAGGDSRPGGGHLLHRPSGGRGAGVGGLPVLSGPAGSPAVWGGRGEQSSPALVFVPADRYAGGVFLPARRGKAPGESTLLL